MHNVTKCSMTKTYIELRNGRKVSLTEKQKAMLDARDERLKKARGK